MTWAQRKDSLFITINVSDVKDAKISLTADRATFSGVSGGRTYEANLEFFAAVDPSDAVSSRTTQRGRRTPDNLLYRQQQRIRLAESEWYRY